MHTIACLSQKGGVGKSTLSRLISTAYAHSGWNVKIADFNVKQKTSTDWAAMRMAAEIEPAIAAEAFANIAQAMRQEDQFDLMVFDGRPDSDTTSLDIAKRSELVVIPVGVSLDDLRPQVLFAHELRSKGVERGRMIFVINRTVDSQVASDDARSFIDQAGYQVARTDIPLKTGYQIAQNQGRSILETNFPTLNERSGNLAQEIVIALKKAVKGAAA